MAIINVYLNSEVDSAILEDHIIKNKEEEFYRYFIKQCHEVLLNSNSTFKARKRSLDYLTKFKSIEELTNSILTDLGYKNFQACFVGNYSHVESSKDLDIELNDENKELLLKDSLILLSDPLYISNYEAVYVEAQQNNLIFECNRRGVAWNRGNIADCLEQVIIGGKMGELIRRD